jgi:hypothetical protein
MSVYVSWGEGHNLYNRDSEYYDSDITIWERYMMNVKRGWVLSNPIKKVETTDENGVTRGKFVSDSGMGIMGRNRGLMMLDSWIYYGNNYLMNKEISVDDLIQEFHEEVGEEYHYWGINGDTWTPSTTKEELTTNNKRTNNK